MKAFIAATILMFVAQAGPAQRTMPERYPVVSGNSERIDTTLFQDGDVLRQVPLPDGRRMDGLRSAAGYSLRIYDSVYPFAVVKNFSPEGTIRQKGVSLGGNACPLGTWYFFEDKSGIARANDYDAAYRFDIYALLRKLDGLGIPALPRSYQRTGMHTSVFKEEDGSTPVYTVEWLKSPGEIGRLRISGIDGTILKTETIPYNNN